MAIKNINQEGQSLFEILFALAIMAMIGVAVVSLSVSAVRNNIYANNKTLANKYNLETQEWIRSQKDNDFNKVWTNGGNNKTKDYCLPNLDDSNWWNQKEDCEEVADYIPGTTFYRIMGLEKVDLNPAISGNESIRVVVTVEWTDGQGDHDSKSETYITDWKTQSW